jgi:hypothetical protein
MTSKIERDRNQIGVALSTKAPAEHFKQICDKYGLVQGVILERFMISYTVGLEKNKTDVLVACEAITGPAEMHFDNLRPYSSPKILTGEYSEEQ